MRTIFWSCLFFLVCSEKIAKGQATDASSMKFFRSGTIGQEKPGVELQDGERLDVSGFTPEYDKSFFEKVRFNQLMSWLSTNEINCPVVSPAQRIGASVRRPSKIVAVGPNYRVWLKNTEIQNI